MELIYAREVEGDRFCATEIGKFDGFKRIDIDLGDRNDFQVDFSLTEELAQKYQSGDYFFISDTEYGGRMRYQETSSKTGELIWKGYTWRGMLTKAIICPPTGQDYYTISGDANEIIDQVLWDSLEGETLITGVEETSGIMIQNYRFDRYCTVLEGLTKMLAKVGAKIKISRR